MYHRIKAHRPGEKISRKQEGKLIWLRLFGLAVLIAVILQIARPASMHWSTLSLPVALRWIGAAWAVTSLPLIYWVFHTLGSNLTDTVVTRKDHTLVTRGPYRWVRHPLYTTLVVWWMGMSLLLSSWLIPLLFSPIGVYLYIRTPLEEANLVERFGEAYGGYMNRTGRFLPRLRE